MAVDTRTPIGPVKPSLPAARKPLLGDVARQSSLFDPTISRRVRVVFWLLATGVFVVSLGWWSHGTDVGDVGESFVPMAAVVQEVPQCAYPADSWSAVPPLYPVLGAGIMAVTHIGIGDARLVRFEGTGCRTTFSGSIDIAPLIVIGATVWPALALGFVLLLRAARKSRTRWEPIGLCLLACSPPLMSALVRDLHPEDIFAMAFVLFAVAAAIRSRWFAAGLLIAVACCFKQFALLPAVPLLVVAPRAGKIRYAVGAVCAAGLILVPLELLMGKRLIGVMRGVDATPSFLGTAAVGRLGLHGMALELIARVVPLIGAAIAAAWARSRLGNAVTEPAPLVALVAVALVLRLVFEVSLFSYYFMATSVILITLDIVIGRIRIETVGWIVACTAIYPPRFDPLVLFQNAHPVVAQFIIVIPACTLVAIPLYRLSAVAGAGTHGAETELQLPESVSVR